MLQEHKTLVFTIKFWSSPHGLITLSVPCLDQSRFLGTSEEEISILTTQRVYTTISKEYRLDQSTWQMINKWRKYSTAVTQGVVVQ